MVTGKWFSRIDLGTDATLALRAESLDCQLNHVAIF